MYFPNTRTSFQISFIMPPCTFHFVEIAQLLNWPRAFKLNFDIQIKD